MTADSVLWWSLAILISSISLNVACAVTSWRSASRSTRAAKRALRSALTLATLATDQAALSTSLASLTKTVKRLSSRDGMEALRERTASNQSAAIQPTDTKVEKLRKLGLAGKMGADFARAQMRLVPDQVNTPEE